MEKTKEELKVMAYDIMKKIEILRQELMKLNLEIAKMEKDAV